MYDGWKWLGNWIFQVNYDYQYLVIWHTLQEYTNAFPCIVAYPPGVPEFIPVFCGIPFRSTWMHSRVLWHALQEYTNASPCFVAYPPRVPEYIPVFCGIPYRSIWVHPRVLWGLCCSIVSILYNSLYLHFYFTFWFFQSLDLRLLSTLLTSSNISWI
jgi:hypothetical protein